jgi:hypothetical protein
MPQAFLDALSESQAISKYGASIVYGATLGNSDGSLGNPYISQISFPTENTDVFGRLKTTTHQNIYEADFEYGPQPLRWESLVLGAGTITHLPGQGGVRMRLTTASGDATIRQSRPYHRYQPGKSMFMASAVAFGTALTNQVNRVGFFDDSNGVFFEQNGTVTGSNPFGMCVVVRSDAGGTISEIRTTLDQWNGIAAQRAAIDWSRIQMLWIEYAWYGAGTVRWGVTINGQQILLHAIGFGNRAATTGAWSRTGNLPVRYEQRNTGVTTAINDMIHYGVSVIAEGGQDDQRGFTYSYGMALGTPRRTVAAATIRFPVLTIRNRVMGTIEFSQSNSPATGGSTSTLVVGGASWTTNQWQGRFLFLPAAPLPTATVGNSAAGNIGTLTFSSAHNLTLGSLITMGGFTPAGWNGTWTVISVLSTTQVTVQLTTNPGALTVFGTATTPITARITSNTSTTLTIGDVVTGNALPAALTAGLNYTIGLLNRGQILPRRLMISTSAICQVEIIASIPNSPIILTGASFVAVSSLGSGSSFVERDVSATALTGGESVFKFTAPAGGSGLQDIDLSNLFPLYNTIRGNLPDLLTIAVSTQTGVASDVGVDIICQEAAS